VVVDCGRVNLELSEVYLETVLLAATGLWWLLNVCPKPGMSNMRSMGRMWPFACIPAARTKDTVIWSFNGQNCVYNLNWINVCRSQKNGMLFFIQNVFYTWKYDRLFPSVKNILNTENIIYVRHVKHAAHRPHVVCGPHHNTNLTHMALRGPSV
jgi:hypothetical protein